MAFVSESRRSSSAPWEEVLCLHKAEAKALLPLLEQRLKVAEEKMERYQSLHEVGEMTGRQESCLEKWEEEVERLGSIISCINAF